jgi:hypothetical protein
MLPAIGAFGALSSGGRLGMVPAAAQQAMALPLHTVDQRDAQGRAAARIGGLALLPAEAGERSAAGRRTLATREDRGAAPGRLPEQRAALDQAQIEELRPDNPPLRHDDAPRPGAGARLGLRHYALAGEPPPQVPRVDLTF